MSSENETLKFTERDVVNMTAWNRSRETQEYERQSSRRLKHFTEVICTHGSVKHRFIEGDIYAMGEAANNALYVLNSDANSDPVNFGVHCSGDEFIPDTGEMGEDDPVFEIIV